MAGITRVQAKALAIVGAAWVLVLVYAWPGIMTNDCFDQLREGRAGFYTDGHPPIVAVIWRYLDKIVAGPALMYLLQTAAFFAALFVVFRRLFEPVRAAVVTVCVALFPPVLAPMTVVWKDAQMASLLLLGFAGLLSTRRRFRLAALASLWLATAVRYNAAAATLPLIVLLFEWRPMRWYARYPLAILVWIAITGSTLLVNRALTDRQMHFFTSSIATHDIAGTLAHLDGELPDGELRTLLAGTQARVDTQIHAALRRQYKPSDFSPLVLPEQRIWDLPIMGDQPAPAEQRAAMNRAWLEVIGRYPRAYLAHRFAVFHAVLGFPKKSAGVMVQVSRGQNRLFAIPMKIEHRPYIFQNIMQRQIERVARNTPLFRPWIYLVLAVVFAVLARRQRDVLALLASGTGVVLSLFPLAATPDYRYSHWLVATVVIAGVIVFTRRFRPCA